MKQLFEDFVDDLRQTHGENLRSVILYGSAAAGDFISHESDYNILIVLDCITPEDLRKSHPTVREWNKTGNPVPVYFSAEEIANAGDVFPIEFHFMESARKVLYGEDVFENVKISDRYLRHQTEFELRSKLLRLRRKYIHASTNPERLAEMMAGSLTSFAAVFRAVLILLGKLPPIKKRDIVEETVSELGLRKDPFDKIFRIRETNYEGSLGEHETNEIFADYIRQIEAVIAAVDGLDKFRDEN
ncbi:MAG: nucleotidyltransferase domain-containing protein [Pyrinomonadaceae bacterium]